MKNKLLKPSLEQIKYFFNVFNREYFNNKLPQIEIKLHTTQKASGAFSFERKGTKIIPKSISISNQILFTELSFKSTLLHEMIHYYDIILNPNDALLLNYDAHGEFFQEELKRLNNFGFEVSTLCDLNLKEKYVNLKQIKPIKIIFFIKNDEFCFFYPKNERILNNFLKRNSFYFEEIFTVSCNTYDFMDYQSTSNINTYYNCSKEIFDKYVNKNYGNKK